MENPAAPVKSWALKGSPMPRNAPPPEGNVTFGASIFFGSDIYFL
jgi:hypothetical protein